MATTEYEMLWKYVFLRLKHDTLMRVSWTRTSKKSNSRLSLTDKLESCVFSILLTLIIQFNFLIPAAF